MIGAGKPLYVTTPCSTVWLRSMSTSHLLGAFFGLPLSRADRGKNCNQDPDDVDECGRVSAVIDRVHDQTATSNGIQKLVVAGIGSQLGERNHCVSSKQQRG